MHFHQVLFSRMSRIGFHEQTKVTQQSLQQSYVILSNILIYYRKNCQENKELGNFKIKVILILLLRIANKTRNPVRLSHINISEFYYINPVYRRQKNFRNNDKICETCHSNLQINVYYTYKKHLNNILT